jgi:hypothetical protein
MEDSKIVLTFHVIDEMCFFALRCCVLAFRSCRFVHGYYFWQARGFHEVCRSDRKLGDRNIVRLAKALESNRTLTTLILQCACSTAVVTAGVGFGLCCVVYDCGLVENAIRC